MATLSPHFFQDADIASINDRKLAVQARTANFTHQSMQRVVRGVRVLLDLSLTYLACLAAFTLHFNWGLGQEETQSIDLIINYQSLYMGICLLMLFYNWTQRLYAQTTGSKTEELLKVGRATVLMLLTLFSVLFFYRDASYSRVFMLLAGLLIPLLVGGGRATLSTVLNHLHARGYGNRRVIFVGSGKHARFVYGKLLKHPEAGYAAVGYVQCNGQNELKGLLPQLGGLSSFQGILREHHADEVIVAMQASHHQECARVVQEAIGEGVAVRLLPEVYQFIPEPVSMEAIRGVHVLSPRTSPLMGVNTLVKRTMDLVLATGLMVVLSPLFAALALLIYLEDRGPIFYRQERVGEKGRIFQIVKFRSMIPKAESLSGPVWASEDDPRTTRIGRWLRHLSLDELPQFYNVFKGEMSFIGPRPERPVFVEEFQGKVLRYNERHDVKPGISGWAQVNGLRGNVSIEERTRYDLFYKDYWSWSLELRIYLQTVWELILRRNAY